MRENQYLGVNAHLHSYYQSHSGWEGFHTNHITKLAEAIDQLLPAGYEVGIDESLQIQEYHPDSGERIRRQKPDIVVYDYEQRPPAGVMSGTPATMTQPIVETFRIDLDAYLDTVVVTLIDDGTVVLRFELLSATNKPGGSGDLQYEIKRANTLKSGVRLVEIDYLHETPSPIRGIPMYPHQPGSHPYRITVSDPSPTFEKGKAHTHAFGVDVAIPELTLPLAGDDVVQVDFGAVYNLTYSSLGIYSRRVDYSMLPQRFETYSPIDQDRIRQRMRMVQQ